MTSPFEKESFGIDHWYCGPGRNDTDEALKDHPPELKAIVNRNEYIRRGLKIIREFGDYTLPHSLKVARYCWELGKELELEPAKLEKFVSAGLIHDLGKVFVNPEILQKHGAMTKPEAEMMHEHVRSSYERIKEIDSDVARIIVRHHEEKKENPYPRNHDRRKNLDASWSGEECRKGERRLFQNEEINALAHQLAIIDEFESLTSFDRPYRQALDMASAKDQKELQKIFQKDYPLAEDQAIVEKLIEINLYLEKTFSRAA